MVHYMFNTCSLIKEWKTLERWKDLWCWNAHLPFLCCLRKMWTTRSVKCPLFPVLHHLPLSSGNWGVLQNVRCWFYDLKCFNYENAEYNVSVSLSLKYYPKKINFSFGQHEYIALFPNFVLWVYMFAFFYISDNQLFQKDHNVSCSFSCLLL